jgi:two-component system, response regulator YesN
MINLLIVDDEWFISDSLSTLKEWPERGIHVIGTASNGKEALSIIEQNQVDILITDIRMPDMDGLELIKAVHQIQQKIEIIVISGYEEFEYAYTALKYKVKGYLLKPIDIDELFGVIDEILKSIPKPDSNQELIEEQPQTYHEVLVTQAQTYAANNLQEPLTLIDVAKELHLNPHYFGQIFKKITGESFTTYITRLRMEKASDLLKQPEMKVYEVSHLVGYNDSKYFTKLFQKKYHLTPKEYRSKVFYR